MVKEGIKIVFVLLLLSQGCNNSNSNKVKFSNYLSQGKENFLKSFQVTDIFSHFPESYDVYNTRVNLNQPACPPLYDCNAQYGDLLFIQKKEKNQIYSFHPDENDIIYKSDYFNENIIIDLTELKKVIYPVEKCNKWFEEKFPLPYFESYDFGLGQSKVKVEIADEAPYFIHTYVVPSDLQVFVFDAKPGDFWKESCNEKRPEALKEWQNGYSRGIAISEKEDLLVYWVMIW